MLDYGYGFLVVVDIPDEDRPSCCYSKDRSIRALFEDYCPEDDELLPLALVYGYVGLAEDVLTGNGKVFIVFVCVV